MISWLTSVCLLAPLAQSAVVKYTFTIEEWVVDFMRPTIQLNGSSLLPWQHPEARVSPFHIAEEQRKHALLINGQYPGPTIDVYENDTVIVKVINKMQSEATALHWHGLHLPGVRLICGIYLNATNGRRPRTWTAQTVFLKAPFFPVNPLPTSFSPTPPALTGTILTWMLFKPLPE